MADTDWNAELAKLRLQAQNKFDFYVVALAFTVLGLAVQTATFGRHPAADFFELVGWVALLISGIAGLHRLEWEPQLLHLFGLERNQDDRITALRQARAQGTRTVHILETGTDLSIAELIVRDERDMEKIDKRLKEIYRKSELGYRVRSIALLVGLCALMLARGGIAAVALIKLAFAAV